MEREIEKVEKLNDLPDEGRLFCGTPDEIADQNVRIAWFQSRLKIAGGRDWNLCRVIEKKTN